MKDLAQAEIRRGNDSVELMIESLQGCGWRHADEVGARTGLCAREMRQAANASQGRIISGQRGYCLIEEADTEDVMHCVNRLRHQAAEMLQRAVEIAAALQQLNEKQTPPIQQELL